MHLAVVSHKPCWRSPASASGFATDGGFAFQIGAISELFDSTTLLVPVSARGGSAGEIPIAGRNLNVVPLDASTRRDVLRKIEFPLWLARNGSRIAREIIRADAVHTPIPGDVGTVGMLMAWLLHKPLFVRHCGNWFVQTTPAEKFWKWFMEKFAGGRNVMLATGGASNAPSAANANLRWIFSTSLRERELLKVARQRRLEPHEPRLVIVCRQDEPKGTGRVISALPLLLQRFPGVTLTVAGEGPDVPQFAELAGRCGVAERVHFTGKLNHDQVIALLQESSLFVYPTTASEGFPKVVLEALACGLPVVTTRVSVLPELLAGGAGVLLDDTSPESVARAVEECLSPAAYSLMSARALAAAEQYSLERWRDQIGKYLESAWGPLLARRI